jgi:hypothetical protein
MAETEPKVGEMVPVKCGFCRQAKATALLTINGDPAFACESCIAEIERAVAKHNASRRPIP